MRMMIGQWNQCLGGDRGCMIAWRCRGAGSGRAGRSEKMYRVGGGQRDGIVRVSARAYAQMKPLKEGEVDFKHFHSYEEATMLLRKWAAAHPNLVELYSVGQSLEGREIWQITITNKKTGRAHRQGRRSSSRAAGTPARSPASRRRSTSSITS